MVEKKCCDESNSAAVEKIVGFVTRVPTLARTDKTQWYDRTSTYQNDRNQVIILWLYGGIGQKTLVSNIL